MPNQILHPSINIPIIPDEGKIEKYPYQLEAEVIDEPNFEEVTGALFQELISPTSGIGVSRFFELYNNLKSIIPGGTLTLTLNSSLTFSDIINSLQIAAERGDSRVFLNELETLVNNVYLTTAVSVGTPYSSDVNTHAYLVSSSLPLTYGNLNDQLKVVLTTVGELFGVSSSLSTQLGNALNRVDLLKANNDQLQIQLDAWSNKIPSGFQIAPDIVEIELGKQVTVKAVAGSGIRPYEIDAIGNDQIVTVIPDPNDNNAFIIRASLVLCGQTYIRIADSGTPPATEVVFITVYALEGVSGVSGVSGDSGVSGIIGIEYPAISTNILEGDLPFVKIGNSLSVYIYGLISDDDLIVTLPSSMNDPGKLDAPPIVMPRDYLHYTIDRKHDTIIFTPFIGDWGLQGTVIGTISISTKSISGVPGYVSRTTSFDIKISADS